MRRCAAALAFGFAAAAAAAAPQHAGAPPAIAPDAMHKLDNSTIAPAEIDAIVERVRRAARVPGVAIAVFDRGEVAYEHAYGLRDTAANLPLTTDTVMIAASLTKPAFAHVVLRHVDAGELALDTPVERYLPQPLAAYPRWQDLADDPRRHRITARMLLAHTSGLPNWRQFEDDRRLHLHFEPGTRFAYSGEGIALLQFVLETVAHAPLDVLMQRELIEPFGMQRSAMLWQPRFEDDHATEYDTDGSSLGAQRRRKADAAGGLETCLHDYARFVIGAMRGDGLSAHAHAQQLTPQIAIRALHEFPTLATQPAADANRGIGLSYALGWGRFETPYGPALFKEGHDDGLRHYVVYFPRVRRGLLIMSNGANGEDMYDALLSELIGDRFTPLTWEGFAPAAGLGAATPH